MRLFSRSRSEASYASLLWVDSSRFPGVKFRIRKISLRQRIELSARVRDLTLRNEFLKAGELTDQLEAAHADLLVQRLYLEWALVDIKGITIDGKPVSVGSLIESGPEDLAIEIGTATRAGLELSDLERKNF